MAREVKRQQQQQRAQAQQQQKAEAAAALQRGGPTADLAAGSNSGEAQVGGCCQ